MQIRVMVIGDVVGRPGRDALKTALPGYRKSENINFVVANGENAAAGSGITPDLLRDFLESGVDVVTTGDHVYRRKEIMEVIHKEPRLLRPANYPPAAAGRGAGIFKVDGTLSIGVINLQGRVFMDPIECPFTAVDDCLSKMAGTRVIIVDMHAEATSEKIAIGWYLDGRVSLVFGTHTHVATADERILPGGTANITDVGMTGPHESVLGRRVDRVLKAFTTHMPSPFDVAEKDVRISGAVATIDVDTGRAVDIKRVQISV
ncbi:MAG: TIGR00282 family metallophosphoesterase [Planctomycetota bacterium]